MQFLSVPGNCLVRAEAKRIKTLCPEMLQAMLARGRKRMLAIVTAGKTGKAALSYNNIISEKQNRRNIIIETNAK